MWRPVLLIICAMAGFFLAQNHMISFLGADPVGTFVAAVIGFFVGVVLIVLAENVLGGNPTSFR